MTKTDPRFNPDLQKNKQQTRESTNPIQGKEIGNSTILSEHLANDSVTADKIATGAVGTSEINTSATPTVSTIYANNWFRSNGNTGWYNESYGGGIFMEDSTYVKVYNSKAFMPSAGSGNNGIIFPLNPGGGGGDSAFIKYYPYSGEACFLDIQISNDSNDMIRLVSPVGRAEISSRLYLVSIGSRGTTGQVITTPNDSVANAIRANGYIEWLTDVGYIGTTYFLSDIRKKDNIERTKEKAINVLKNIEYISFDWKPDSGSSGHVKLGMSAQQVQSIDPTFVRELSDSTLMIHEPSIMPYLGKAIQEQQELIEKQQKTIESLEARLNLLEDLLK